MTWLKACVLAVLVFASANHCRALDLACFLQGDASAETCAHECNDCRCESEPGGSCQLLAPVKELVIIPATPLTVTELPDALLAPSEPRAHLARHGDDERQDWLAATSRFRERRAWPARAP